MTTHTKRILRCIASAFTVSFAIADTTPHSLSGGPFSQNWSNVGLITADDNWSGVPCITGYRGDGLTTATGVDPRTVVAPSTVVDVIANQTAPNTNTAGGVGEFEITNPTIALQGSGTADAPYISIFLNTTGVPAVTVSYKVRDIDGGADNAQQQVALQYRIGNSGDFTDVPAGYVADATTGGSATQETSISVTLPAAVVGNALLEVRIITTNAGGSDEWVGIDDIMVSASDAIEPQASTFAPLDNATNAPITATPSIIFNETVQKGTGDILIKRSSDNSIFDTIAVGSSQVVVSTDTVTITPTTNFANSTGYYIEIPAGAIEDLAGNDYAGISGPTAWNFTTLAASALPMAAETFETGWRINPTGASTVADYYGEGSGQGNFARYDMGVFNFTKLDFGLSGASQITGIPEITFTLTHNDRTFTTGTALEFFLTTDAPAGKTFNPAFVNGIDASQYSFAPISLGQFPYTPKAGGQTDVFTLVLSPAAEAALVSRINTGEDFGIILAAVNAPDAITFSGKGNTFDPGDPLLKITVNETTGVDTTPPTVAFFTPADGSGGLPVSSNLKINFNELVQKGLTGNITIFRAGDNSVFETIDVNSSAVTVNLGTVTIDPVGTLESAGNYYLQVTAGAIEDVSGNDFAGIADTTTWNFSTAQPPITSVGPFTASENAPAGTVVGDLNPAVSGKEGIKYAMLGGSGGSTMVKGTPGAGYLVTPVFTIGDTVEGSTGALNATSAGNFSPPGTPDGLGAFSLNANTVRVFMNHEIEIPNSGSGAFPFTLANGTVLNKGGARISYFDIDKASRRVVDAGLAIARMYDRAGNVVTSTSQLELGGLDRMCSASLYEPESFGTGRGLMDRVYLTGEETSTAFGHPHGGTYWALDTSNGDFWALPDFGRGSWENAALVDTGTTTHVAFLLGDDAEGRPLYLYVGAKDSSPGANFIERNGLKGGQLYVWKSNNGNTTPQQFNGTGNFREGTWVAIDAKNAGAAGSSGHDAAGYKNDTTLKSEAISLGAFLLSRPEDLATNPTDGSMVAFTSTGRGNLYPADNWGDTYVLDIDFTGAVPTSGFLRIVYSGDDAGNGQFMSPEEGLRCPDNLDWADDGSLYVQEDQSNQVGSFGAAGFETSIWRLDLSGDLSDANPTNIVAQATRVAEVDRGTVLPLGSADGNTGDFGNWETSGIIDVSSLFGEVAGTLFLFDIQSHSITSGLISSKNLYEGGQLCFLEKGIEQGAFALNPNTGVITIANPDAISLDGQTVYELRLQAFDGTNTTLDQVTININNAPVTLTNDFKVATYNTSLFREGGATLAGELATVTSSQAQAIARVIQRNNPDVILLNEFDYDAAGLSAKRFRENYLEVAQSGESPVYYPYAFIAPSNTGVHSGFDLDNNGSVVSTPGATGYGEDAFGFGTRAGQYSFVVLSKFPIDTANIRTFQKFLWKDMPSALLPDNPNIAGTGDWYSPAELDVFRLSSKNHADVPVLVNGTPVHILASHPTPPVFDDPASGAPWIAGVDHNGRRNSDEIRFWSDYVNPAASSYIYDDNETPGTASGGLPANTRFVICGDQNADNNEGDSTDPAIKQLIGGGVIPANPAVNSTFLPAGGSGPEPDDTAAFSGGVRVDYALPSAFGLTVNSGAVFWPPTSPGSISDATSQTDHHMVYLNLTLSGVTLPPNVDLATYYAPASGLSGAPLMNALHGIIDDHTIIDYNNVDEIMQVIDAANADDLRLIYSIATLPKASFVGSAPDNSAWNREHVWPRNDGVGDDGPDFSDLHHLFPCQVNVNSLRSALYFDESTNLESDPFAPESFKDTNSWEPLDRDKGLVARAVLYMMTRYDGSDPLTTDLVLNNNPVFAGTDMGKLDTLLTWNRMFPPSDYEKARNNAIYGGVSVGPLTYAQGNRNPFIDVPQFADAILIPSGMTSFGKWQTENFSLAQLFDDAVSGRNADADGDGRDTYAEFLLNTDPLSGADTPLVFTRNGNQVTLVFHRPIAEIPEQADIQSCTTLEQEDWDDVPNWKTTSVITQVGDYERIEFTTMLAAPEIETRRFWRVAFD
jgi:endonuclease I